MKSLPTKTRPLNISEFSHEGSHWRARLLESYIRLYMESTGLGIDEIVLVEKRSNEGFRVEWYCEPKGVNK